MIADSGCALNHFGHPAPGPPVAAKAVGWGPTRQFLNDLVHLLRAELGRASGSGTGLQGR
jgi:hypothetical protein